MSKLESVVTHSQGIFQDQESPAFYSKDFWDHQLSVSSSFSRDCWPFFSSQLFSRFIESVARTLASINWIPVYNGHASLRIQLPTWPPDFVTEASLMLCGFLSAGSASSSAFSLKISVYVHIGFCEELPRSRRYGRQFGHSNMLSFFYLGLGRRFAGITPFFLPGPSF